MPTVSSPTRPAAAIRPTPRQLEYQDWECGLFLHFGIRTFYEGHRDWDGKPMSPLAFNPQHLDCDQWATVAKAGGMRYLVLVAKHHDGFANWPTAYSQFSVAQTPWRGGQGDVVREFVDACRRHGLAIGLYYSPAEQGPGFHDAKTYDAHFLNQIGELLGHYGPIDMLWFDGCGSENHSYDWPRIIGRIRELQPHILLFNMGDPDYRWVGNEAGLADLTNHNVVDCVPLSVRTTGTVAQPEPRWLPAECDFMMRDRNWFYSDQDAHTVKSLQELLGIYYYSVGRGANFLVNIGPDRRGLLPEPDATRLAEFGSELRRRFERPLARLEDGTITAAGWEFAPAAPLLLDHVVIQEDQAAGQHIERFALRIEPYLGHQGGWITLYEGRTVGHKAIIPLTPVRARRVRVEVIESSGPWQLRDTRLYQTV